MELSINYLDLDSEKIFSARVEIGNGLINKIEQIPEDLSLPYMVPGFIDSHIHIESSMMVPSRFAEAVIPHGTIATVSDPHEIANVIGVEGVEYMIKEGNSVPFNFYFGAPSCVPATNPEFETSGAKLDPNDIGKLLESEEIKYLSEMMNFPGAINGDPEVLQKIKAAKDLGKPVDGHAPGLMGKDLSKYISRGISTDHETISIEEGREKIAQGMKVSIREGSAAKNYEALHPLIDEYPGMIMFCSDDLHPDGLQRGHINLLVKRAIEDGHSVWNVLRAACRVPVEHYSLDCGYARVGDKANFFVCSDLQSWKPDSVFLNGEMAFSNARSELELPPVRLVNQFYSNPMEEKDLQVNVKWGQSMKVIEARDEQLVTGTSIYRIKEDSENLESDPVEDILKLVVLSRYGKSEPQVGFVKGFGLKKGAIFSSIAHDCHNIIAAGTNDSLIVRAIKKVQEANGGIGYIDDGKELIIPLPVAGIMSDKDLGIVSDQYQKLNAVLKEKGVSMKSPLMTLSFLSLPVIPSLKLTDKGLFDVENFNFTDLIYHDG